MNPFQICEVSRAPSPRGSHRMTVDKTIATMISAQEGFDEDPKLTTIATQLGMSQFYLCNIFRKTVGISPKRWLWEYRTELARAMIEDRPNAALTTVAFACGFTSAAHFSRLFRKFLSKTPSEFQRASRLVVLSNKYPKSWMPEAMRLEEDRWVEDMRKVALGRMLEKQKDKTSAQRSIDMERGRRHSPL